MGSVIDAGVRLATGGLVDPDLRGEKAADSALHAQDAATGRAEKFARDAYEEQKGYQNDYLTGGKAAFNELAGGKFDLQMDPSYKFRLDEGMKALNAAASSRGLSSSGRALKELSRYGQDYASTEYGKAYDRNFNRLNTVANYGQNAANTLTNAAGQYGQTMGGYQIGMGNAQAANSIGKANRVASDIGQAVQIGTGFLTGGMSLPFSGGGGGGVDVGSYNLSQGAPSSNYNYLYGGR